MNVFVDIFVGPLAEPAFQKALLGGSLVAIVCGVIGCFVILRRMAFLGDALSHAMLAGVTSGYLFMQMVFGIEAHHADARLQREIVVAGHADLLHELVRRLRLLGRRDRRCQQQRQEDYCGSSFHAAPVGVMSIIGE